MVNYQLYRTNVLLGGQMKYDLLLDSNSDETYIKSLHITPISNSVPYNKYVDEEDLINYHHHENIKNYYKEISSSFYNDYLNPVLKSIHPLADHYEGEDSDHTYEMGCRRMNYQLYNKQFEFLCPLWIEHLEDIMNLEFEVQISTSPSRVIPMYTRTIRFGNEREKDKILTDYFNDYLNHTKLNIGCDWVFNISDNEDNCVVHGINVSNGMNTDAKLIKLYHDLIFRERPLLEFNNIIINKLRENCMISKQLFNFNFCFNYEDLLNPFLYNKLKNEHLYINIVAKINGKSLEMRDIFSNHQFIEKNMVCVPEIKLIKTVNEDTGEIIHTVETSKKGTGANVLDYLGDYKHIDLIDKNKMIQTTCHWCRCNNPETHFNFYDGFSLLANNLTSILYYNGETANLNITDAEKQYNVGYPYWCNNYQLKYDDENELMELFTTILKPVFNNEDTNDYLFSHFSKDCWVKNINYRANIDPLDVMILQCDKMSNIESFIKTFLVDYRAWGYRKIKLNNEDLIIIYPFDNSGANRKIIFFHYYDKLTNGLLNDMLYKNILTHFNNCLTKDKFNPKVFEDLYNILSCPDLSNQRTIYFKNSVSPRLAKGPAMGCSEIEYYKSTTKKLLLRELGKIKPFFIKSNDTYKNYQYSKVHFKNVDERYKAYANTAFDPKYPSIGYTSLIVNEKMSYGYIENMDTELEYHNYTSNKITELLPEIKFEYIFLNSTSDSIEKHVYDKLKELYSSVLGDEDESHYESKLNYINNLYKLTHTYIDTDVIGDNQIQYTYKIQIKLK